jgi:predicted Zn finger-like uncharacterized protein
MSFITQCPACETQFKVTPDQLKMSEGWVRCGHCQHVFDASLNLQPWWPEPQTPMQTQPEDPMDASPEPQPSPDTLAQNGMQVDGDAPTCEDDPVRMEAVQEEREPVFDLPPSSEAPKESGAASRSIALEPEPVLESHPPSPAEPSADVSPPQPTPTFIKRAMQKAYWHQTSVRFTLYLLIVFLLMVLSAQ